jgi:ATP-dependent DNA helicase RecQ
LDDLWSEWAGETGEAEVPVTLIRDFFVEAIGERQRAHQTAEGVVLVTAHKAKGVEFAHVTIADGGWSAMGSKSEIEEERRVFYVAATRAKETLTVMVRKDRRTPFPAEMTCESVVDRTPRLQTKGTEAIVARRRYVMIDPTGLVVGWAANIAADRPVHAALQATSAGDAVRLVQRGYSIQIETDRGVPIATLSEAGRKIWEPRLDFVLSAKVTAMVRRTIEQEAEEYRAEAKVKTWEFPVVEVCWNPPS